ncbi:hypothetical protein DY000_02037107 [Brassica cretica]|uniref:Uncharacterized protein n=1 Tax=Brassica cretica TaxID=69181 RepID=A0ABQ7BA28_BRACR|nr:hypothetical protein DY000_02037107 [Brassica cretica]
MACRVALCPFQVISSRGFTKICLTLFDIDLVTKWYQSSSILENHATEESRSRSSGGAPATGIWEDVNDVGRTEAGRGEDEIHGAGRGCDATEVGWILSFGVDATALLGGRKREKG